MPGESFRFIHASDFHLEAPLGDLDSIPSALRESMADAPRRAATAVFEAALVDNIDFLVLSGDLLSPASAGPHGMSLLLDYFEKLNAKKTPVFWAAGVADDPQRWPEAAPLPPNVTLFPKNRAIAVPVERAGRTICMVVGRSSEGRSTLHVPSYRVEPTDEYTVAIGYGASDADALAEGRFDYWALGGRHNRVQLDGGGEGAAVYCGSPQGRSLSEPGPHGYSVVDVDAEQTTRVRAVECDAFRYCYEEIDATEIAAVGSVRNLLGERISRLQHENGGRHLLIGWDISISSGDNLQAIGDTEELLNSLRRDFGAGTPAAWTASLVVRPPKQYPKSWNDEDTILGDFLRAAEKHGKADGRDLDLLPFSEEHEMINRTTAALLTDVSPSAREELLDQATLLGVELLRGGKPNLVS
ncbi:putative metallophosphoesterase YhaO [Novipirellula aureliae]|uniref:Putative metallophosphoesterase YhaO n=1 Tax=Novipirellula aureliae TaxID=2527966 RepID=A0A5C6E528_9BACT|nr:DNA repair exonuclease [Novipirellula aureliae]TWU44042.1 putative metallophosphoesterase YhaO [Novipirellula aureliae]